MTVPVLEGDALPTLAVDAVVEGIVVRVGIMSVGLCETEMLSTSLTVGITSDAGVARLQALIRVEMIKHIQMMKRI